MYCKASWCFTISMLYDPNIFNLNLCLGKILFEGQLIQYTKSPLMVSVLHSQIVWGGIAYSQTLKFEEGGHWIIYKKWI